MHSQRSFTQSQAPARLPFPINVSAAQGMRASSNPEHGQPQPQGGLVRHLPGPPGQFPAPQVRLPLQRHTPSTEVLEHIHPGSTSRGDFHSDPTAHNAMDTYTCGPPNNYVATPSRGLPGPFSYRSLPPPTQPVPLMNRVGTFDGKLTKGKRNPKKKSSDDARMVSKQTFAPQNAPQNTQMPFHPRSPDAMPQVQELHPSSGAVPYAGNYNHPNLPPGYQLGNGSEPFNHPSHHRQVPMQPAMRGHSHVVSNPCSPTAHGLQGSPQDPRSIVPTFPLPTNTQHPGATAKGQLCEGNAAFTSTPVRPHISQPLDPHAFGHQLPDRRMDSRDRQDPVLDFQRAALAPMSNTGQPRFPGTPGLLRVNEVPSHSVREGCTIWIGGLPNEFDKAAVMALLIPCRGIVNVSEPRESSPSKYPINRSYAFAEYVLPNSTIARTTNIRFYSFLNPVDAAEALERLPQTRFSSLPEGTFLTTNYPRSRLCLAPGHYQHGSDRDTKQPASNVSPSKSRKGEDSNRAERPKTEHVRKPSKGSARGKKNSPSSSEGKTGNPSERVSAVDADQKESNLQPEEATLIPDPYGKVGSMTQLSQSSTEGQDSKPMSQHHPGVIQSDVSVETHANQVSRISGDGVQDTSSDPTAKPQVHESHHATSSRPTEGRKKAAKKKSKGSNKLPVPETKGLEPPTVLPTSGNAKPNARAKPSANDAGKFLGDSGHSEEKGKQAGFEIEASRTTARIVPLNPTSALLNDPATVDQSFLGRNPTEDGGEPPKASVANVTRPGGAKDGKEEALETALAPVESALSAVPLEQSDEPRSLAMRRDVSSSTQGSTDTAPSILSFAAPPSSSQTERSNSITQETLSPMVQAACPSSDVALLPVVFEPGQLRDKLEASIVSSNASQSGSAVIAKRGLEGEQPQETRSGAKISNRNTEPGETVTEQKSEISTSLAPSETGKDTKHVQEELRNSTYRESVAFHQGPIKEDPEHNSGTLLIQPSPSDSDRAFSRSPARKRAPSIPPRSSSLAAPSTPIKTHQKKKKPRNLTPMVEASPSKVPGISVEGTKMGSTLQTTGSTRLNLTIDPAAHTLSTDNSKDLPKPETPFLMDDGVRVAPPKINRQIVEASNADRYYAQKNNYQVFHLGNAMQINATFGSLDSSDSASAHPSETSTPDHFSTEKHNDLETTLREAGFRSLSGTSPFTIKDPHLALFETLNEQGNLLENRTNKDGPVLSWVDEKGTLGPGMSFDAWTKQNEIIEVVKKATAVKRLLAGSTSHPWTKIETHREQLSQFVAHFSSDAQAQQNTKMKALQVLKAKALLGTIPQHESSTCEMQKWSRNVCLFMEENASGPSPAYAQSRKPATNSSSKASRGTPSRRQQQERRHPVLINKPDRQTRARKLGRDEDAIQTASTELNNSLTNRQTRESEFSPSTFTCRSSSEEQPTPSVVLIPSAALGPVSKLKDLFVEMEKDRRRWSDDRHRVSSPQEEERMTSSDPELKPLGGEFDVRRETEVKDVEPEEEFKETESEVLQKPHEDKQSESTGEELGSEVGRHDQRMTAKSYETNDPASAESKEEALQSPEDPTHRRQTSQLLGASSPSFDSNHTTSNEGSSGEAQHNRPRGAHSPLKRSGYNAVVGRGTDGKRGGKKEASKDPWALPQGEQPWGLGEGRYEKKKRGRQ